MIALDTNILARYLLNDTPKQADIAEKILCGATRSTAPITVFLELVWVLESCSFRRSEIVNSIQLLCGLENFFPENLAALAQAIHWYSGGMDFADAMHLAMSKNATEFKTFDKAFAKSAKKLVAFPVVTIARSI